MRRFNGLSSLVVMLLVSMLLSACQQDVAPTAGASPDESMATSEIAATDAPEATATSEPEATEAPEPTATSEPEATDTPDATVTSEPEATEAMETTLSVEEKIANAMSAGPAPIAQDATILDYPEEGRGNWPDEVAPELIEMRAGDNGWTCIVDIPDTPGNDPMCLNETYLEVLMSNYNLVDAPSTGVGFGYMLQGGGPIGSPPHLMVFVPESNESFDPFGTEPGPFPWIMFPETSQQHLMVLLPPPAEAVIAAEDKIANAMSAGPAPIAQDATILDYPEEGRGNWPDEPAPELLEIRAGDNGWTCIVDIPDTPGNDPMCLNEIYLGVLLSQYNHDDVPSTGVGFGYMLQGGGPIGSPPHMMVFVPESNESFDAFGTEPGPFPWIMFPETPQQHLMVLGQAGGD